MLDATTVLNVLERDSQSIESQLGPQWTEFGHRVGDLANQFKAVAGEDDSQVAASDLELAVNDLLEICWDYEEPASPDAAPFGIWGYLTPRIRVIRP